MHLTVNFTLKTLKNPASEANLNSTESYRALLKDHYMELASVKISLILMLPNLCDTRCTKIILVQFFSFVVDIKKVYPSSNK